MFTDVGSKFKNSLEGNELKQTTTSDIKKNCHWDSSKIPEIKPYITSVSLQTFIGRVSSKGVDLEIKNTEKGVQWNPI